MINPLWLLFSFNRYDYFHKAIVINPLWLLYKAIDDKSIVVAFHKDNIDKSIVVTFHKDNNDKSIGAAFQL